MLTRHIKTHGQVLIAEGYLFEFIRRGRLRPGSLVPEVVLDHPEIVTGLHQEFVDAGSDVVQAFTVSIVDHDSSVGERMYFFASPLCGLGHDSSVRELMFFTVCSLRGRVLFPAVVEYFMGVFPG